jgi:hypothetical protein
MKNTLSEPANNGKDVFRLVQIPLSSAVLVSGVGWLGVPASGPQFDWGKGQ